MLQNLRLWASRLRHSPPGDRLVSFARRVLFRIESQLNRGVCAVDICGGMGFGATLSHMLQVLAYCEEHRLLPVVRISNRLYLPSGETAGDWFSLYFSNKRLGADTPRPRYYAKIQKNNDYPHVDQRQLDLARAYRLFHESIEIAPSLYRIADNFATNLLRPPIIGVHYRGTDKVSEAPRTQWQAVIDQIANARYLLPEATTLFVASDEMGFVEFLTRREIGLDVVPYTGTQVSVGGRAVHFSPGDARVKGIEAMVTILLLAKCSLVIRTPSHLSAWARVLNPNQKVIMLDRPFDTHLHFPDLQIWEERQQCAHLPEVSSAQVESVKG